MASQTISLSTSSATCPITVERGAIERLYPRLQRLYPGRQLRPYVLTSPRIWKLWSAPFLASFPPQSQPEVLLQPAGEQHKRLGAIERLAEQMARRGADRDALLIAFGGGVVGDMAGLLAAIYMRGIDCVQVPTTLLAQVDSSVGGKTGVNLAAGKNLVGAFRQPRAVIVDPGLLSTLPARELRAGLQESIKAGIISDLRLFTYLTREKTLISAGDLVALTRVIAASLRVKAAVVSADEHEAGLRMTLNFGHTLGHAIEAATRYRALLHGEAVAWGSIAALHLSRSRGTISDEQFASMANLILAYGPLPRFRATAAQLVRLSAADKKNRGGRRAFVLAKGIGATEVVHDVSDEELATAADAMLSDMLAGVGGRA